MDDQKTICRRCLEDIMGAHDKVNSHEWKLIPMSDIPCSFCPPPAFFQDKRSIKGGETMKD